MSRFALVAMAWVVLAASSLWVEGTEGTGHSAIRSFSAAQIEPGQRLEVTIRVRDYGPFGQVVETLPEGFSYLGATQPEATVEIEGRTIKFTLLGEEEFTYAVSTPDAEGNYNFSGVLLDMNKVEEEIGGDVDLRVGPDPTEVPTPTSIPATPSTTTPEATPTPRDRATATPEPTVAAIRRPTATATRAPTDTPVAAPSQADATIQPTPPAATPTSTPALTREATQPAPSMPTPVVSPATIPSPTALPISPLTQEAPSDQPEDRGATVELILTALVVITIGSIMGGFIVFVVRNRRFW